VFPTAFSGFNRKAVRVGKVIFSSFVTDYLSGIYKTPDKNVFLLKLLPCSAWTPVLCVLCYIPLSSQVKEMLLSKDTWLGRLQLFVLLFLETDMWQIQCHSLAGTKLKSPSTRCPYWNTYQCITANIHCCEQPKMNYFFCCPLLSPVPSLPLRNTFFHFDR